MKHTTRIFEIVAVEPYKINGLIYWKNLIIN